jgi:16S rRNA (uracil1498-N3)-methyltransferase
MPHEGQTHNPHRFFCSVLPKAADFADPANSSDGTGGAGDASQDASGVGISDPRCTLDRLESHHARKALRLSAGDPVELFDGQGTLAQATIERYDAARALCYITSIEHHPPITPSLTVASAVPKGSLADAMVTQLSQLGVDTYIPLQTDHSVAMPSAAKLERFAKSTTETAKQCRRLWLMHIDEPQTPAAAWSADAYDLMLITSPSSDPLPDLADRLRASQRVLVLVGPEGGWSPAELQAAAKSGCVSWSIAPNILRIETAATAVPAILRYLGLP